MEIRIQEKTKAGIKAFGVVVVVVVVVVVALCSLQFTQSNSTTLHLKKGSHLVLIGNNLGSRMMNHGHFETEYLLPATRSIAAK